MINAYGTYLMGVPVKITSFRARLTRAVVEHEYPMRHGVITEDRGFGAEKYEVSCIFHDGSYEDYYDLLKKLREKPMGDLVELMHPDVGPLMGQVGDIEAGFDDDSAEKAARISFTFTVDGVSSTSAVRYDIPGSMDDQVELGLTDQQASALADLTAAASMTMKDAAASLSNNTSSSARETLEKSMDPTKGILEQCSETVGKVREMVKVADGVVSTLEAQLAQVQGMANTVTSTIEYAATIPGRLIGSVARTAESLVKAHQTVEAAPELFMRGVRSSMIELEDSLGLNDEVTDTTPIGIVKLATRQAVRTHLRVATAMLAASYLGKMYAGDGVARAQSRRAELASAFDEEGNYLNPPSARASMSVSSVERSLAASREMLQEALELKPHMHTLEAQAKILRKYADSIKRDLGGARSVYVDGPMPLVSVLHAGGLPYSAAERILALNEIPDPNRVQGWVNLCG